MTGVQTCALPILLDGHTSVKELVKKTLQNIEKEGFSAVCDSSYLPGNLALPRKQEIFACLNRYRGLKM